jgi:hypothetical protein
LVLSNLILGNKLGYVKGVNTSLAFQKGILKEFQSKFWVAVGILYGYGLGLGSWYCENS